MMYFFFSSRRRHTRFDCDWSSDVCSSDLTRHRPAPAPQILGQGPQADRAPAGVDTSRVLERQGAQASGLRPIKLRSIALRPALKRTDPVLEHGDLERRDLTLAHPALQQGQAPAHERRVSDRMLQDEPRRPRALLAHARATGPAMGVDEGCQASRMTLMQRFHAWMVTLEERPVAGQVLEQREVAAGHLEQL